jgi:hypothetical protein
MRRVWSTHYLAIKVQCASTYFVTCPIQPKQQRHFYGVYHGVTRLCGVPGPLFVRLASKQPIVACPYRLATLELSGVSLVAISFRASMTVATTTRVTTAGWCVRQVTARSAVDGGRAADSRR